MLSFEVIKSGKAIQVTCDAEGLSKLIGSLAELIGQRADHLHLRTPEAGGNELNKTTPFGGEGVGEVIISYAEHGEN